MLVQRVVAPIGGTLSWTVVDETFEPVEPVETYLAHLEAIERSPNTVRAYASSLRLWFEHLAVRGVAWGHRRACRRRPVRIVVALPARRRDRHQRQRVEPGGGDGEPPPGGGVRSL